jgi:serine/threonine protein kinase
MNIIHRDIKAENMLMEYKVSNKGGNPLDISAKLADWGLATLYDPDDKGLRDFVGSDDHMAPEIIRLWANPDLDTELKERAELGLEISDKEYTKAHTNKENRYNEKVDVWALGVMIYQLFTGRTPFDEGGEYE